MLYRGYVVSILSFLCVMSRVCCCVIVTVAAAAAAVVVTVVVCACMHVCTGLVAENSSDTGFSSTPRGMLSVTFRIDHFPRMWSSSETGNIPETTQRGKLKMTGELWWYCC